MIRDITAKELVDIIAKYNLEDWTLFTYSGLDDVVLTSPNFENDTMLAVIHTYIPTNIQEYSKEYPYPDNWKTLSRKELADAIFSKKAYPWEPVEFIPLIVHELIESRALRECLRDGGMYA